jgi:hypothetical protein
MKKPRHTPEHKETNRQALKMLEMMYQDIPKI